MNPAASTYPTDPPPAHLAASTRSADPFPQFLSLDQLASFLEVSPPHLHWWLYGLWESRRYHTFRIRQRGGTTRRISTPIKPIRDMQTRLARIVQ